MAWRFFAEQMECYFLMLLVAYKHFCVLPSNFCCILQECMDELVGMAKSRNRQGKSPNDLSNSFNLTLYPLFSYSQVGKSWAGVALRPASVLVQEETGRQMKTASESSRFRTAQRMVTVRSAVSRCSGRKRLE